jgi:hypothetical protein
MLKRWEQASDVAEPDWDVDELAPLSLPHRGDPARPAGR